jgi:membrane-anchored glycerophosphoryl diester phosphodiesterase (GDPDase)
MRKAPLVQVSFIWRILRIVIVAADPGPLSSSLDILLQIRKSLNRILAIFKVRRVFVPIQRNETLFGLLREGIGRQLPLMVAHPVLVILHQPVMVIQLHFASLGLVVVVVDARESSHS